MSWSQAADIGQTFVGVSVAIFLGMVMLMANIHTEAKVPVKDPGETYQKCEDSYPYRDDLQEACRLGADGFKTR